jgi:CheY-like chemotaxis protein
MLVDDNGMNTLILQKMLEMIPESTCSFKVVTASNGQEAFELFTQINSTTRLMSDRVRLIFMDCEMPIMDGYESTRLIREAEG